jgi:RNA polymerase sigma-70 factor (ECF subfamily)
MANYYGILALEAQPAAFVAVSHGRGRSALLHQPFRRIFDQHAAAVGRTLRYFGVPEADVADAAQQVFLVVNRRYCEFEGRASLSGWIREICMRVAYAHRRQRRRRREDTVADPPQRSIDPQQHEEVERREDRDLATRLLRTLDDKQRALIVLYEIEMLPMPEVARMLGCPLQTAYTRRMSALEKLRQTLRLQSTETR